MTRKFKFEKLIRDKILDSMLSNPDQNPQWKTLSDEDFIIELKKKLLEEVHELIKLETIDPEEIADIQEVLNYIISVSSSSKEEIEKLMKEKKEKVGGFDKRAFVGIQEINDDSEWVDEYLKQPEKYPEII